MKIFEEHSNSKFEPVVTDWVAKELVVPLVDLDCLARCVSARCKANPRLPVRRLVMRLAWLGLAWLAVAWVVSELFELGGLALAVLALGWVGLVAGWVGWTGLVGFCLAVQVPE